ncbi:MAG: nitrilase-related carbon-nitrogen hydrolase [Crocinitomicaceae bacterium]|nr:nitrilase-related carbon-nitrogen hydrolase [Crocinitomicaceae bacterium]|tara:strand:+ start:471 stop:1238 length:768 start_codon:yes stop_codon:yes gene_type:complete
MQDLTITLVQPEQLWEDVSGNIENYEQLLSTSNNSDLIILPELFQTGFTMNLELAEKMSGRSIQWLLDTSKKKNAAIYTSLIIEEGGDFFNRGVFIQPDGKINWYDKRKTFGLAREGDFFSSGTKEQIIAYKGWKLQLQICYDLRFPELVRNRIDEHGETAYDVILYVANWPAKRAPHWRSLLNARAIENQCYIAAVNRVGIDGNGFNYSGDSSLTDALGNTYPLTPCKQEIKSFVIKYKDLAEIREMLPFLKDR